MATIHDIPPEILLKIAGIGGNPWTYFEHGQYGVAESKARKFRIVSGCKKWQGPGQIKLWEAAHFSNRGRRDAPALFAASEGTKRGIKTRELSIEARTSEEVGLIVAASHGVQELLLTFVENLDPAFLEDAALADLRELNLVCIEFNDPRNSNLYPRFKLVNLQLLIDLNVSFSPRISASLLQPSVTSAAYSFAKLTTPIQSCTQYRHEILAALTSHAPNLQRLALLYHEDNSEVRQFLATCVNVTELVFRAPDFQLLEFLSGRLKRLKLFANCLKEDAEFFGTKGGSESLGSLSEVVLDPHDMYDEDQTVFDSIKINLEAACKRRKIKFEVQTSRYGSFWARFGWAR